MLILRIFILSVAVAVPVWVMAYSIFLILNHH